MADQCAPHSVEMVNSSSFLSHIIRFRFSIEIGRCRRRRHLDIIAGCFVHHLMHSEAKQMSVKQHTVDRTRAAAVYDELLSSVHKMLLLFIQNYKTRHACCLFSVYVCYQFCLLLVSTSFARTNQRTKSTLAQSVGLSKMTERKMKMKIFPYARNTHDKFIIVVPFCLINICHINIKIARD